MKLKSTTLIISLFLSSCSNEVIINDKLSISRWNDEGYSLQFNDEESWLGIVRPDITSYDLQNNILILERAYKNESTEYYLINLDSLNKPKDLTDSSLTKKQFQNKINRLGINYKPKKLK